MDVKKELQRVIQELKKPLNKKDRYLLECRQIQLEYNVDYADAVEIINNKGLLK